MPPEFRVGQIVEDQIYTTSTEISYLRIIAIVWSPYTKKIVYKVEVLDEQFKSKEYIKLKINAEIFLKSAKLAPESMQLLYGFRE